MEKQSLPAGYSKKDPANQEMQQVINEEEEEEKKSPFSSSRKNVWWPTLKPFVNGGATGTLSLGLGYLCHTSISYISKLHPQLAKHSLLYDPKYQLLLKKAWAPHTVLLQVIYCTALYGSFEFFTKKMVTANDKRPLTLYQEACCGLTSGAIAACISYPIMSASNIMEADATKAAAQRVNNRNVFHSLYRVAADKGVLALWKGATPVIRAAMVVNMGMLASYDRSIDYCKESLGFDEERAQMGASVASGFFAACSMPIVRVLAVMKIMQLDPKQKPPGFLDCALKLLKVRGPSLFYSGFPLYFASLAPSIMCNWIILEEIRKYETSIGL